MVQLWHGCPCAPERLLDDHSQVPQLRQVVAGRQPAGKYAVNFRQHLLLAGRVEGQGIDDPGNQGGSGVMAGKQKGLDLRAAER